MRIEMFVFSGTGNTWWTARELARLAGDAGDHVAIHSIERHDVADASFLLGAIQRADVLGIAYPVHGSTWPRAMRDFVLHLLDTCKTHEQDLSSPRPPVLVLTSMMLFSGDGALVPRRHFARFGFSLRWAINIALTSNISIPGFRANPYDGDKVERNKQKATTKLERLLRHVRQGDAWLEHRWNVPFRFAAWLQRVLEPPFLKRIRFSVLDDRCTRCFQCEVHCPTRSFDRDGGGQLVITMDTCTYCMRCYNLCPVHAITTRDAPNLPPSYLRLEPIDPAFSYDELHD